MYLAVHPKNGFEKINFFFAESAVITCKFD